MNYYKKTNPTITALKYSFIFIVIFWIIELLQLIGFDFSTYGIYPRENIGLIGILTSPLVHGDIQHLISNTLPFFILSFLLFLFYKRNSVLFLILIWLTTGLLTWIIGRGNAYHIGASGVIYGLVTFLVVGGILSKKWVLILVSILVLVLYSGIMWGIFPTEAGISWEGHLSGAISGIIWAIICRKKLQSTQYQ